MTSETKFRVNNAKSRIGFNQSVEGKCDQELNSMVTIHKSKVTEVFQT